MSKNKSNQATQQAPAPAEKVEDQVTEQTPPVDEKEAVVEQQDPADSTPPEDKPEPEQPKEPEPAPAPAPVPEAVVQAGPFEAGALVAKVQRSRLFDMVLADVDAYAKQMAANLPQTPASAATHQKLLYDTYQRLLKLPAPEFREAIDSIIATFRANATGCFTEGHLFRASEHIALSAVAARGFYHFNHVLLTAAQFDRREAGRLNDLGSLAAWVPSEEAHQLVMNYFR